MSTDSLKLKRLQTLHDLITAGRIKSEDAKDMTIADTDGSHIRLSDPEALQAIARRIQAEMQPDGPQEFIEPGAGI
jgi:hypothetical protein